MDRTINKNKRNCNETCSTKNEKLPFEKRVLLTDTKVFIIHYNVQSLKNIEYQINNHNDTSVFFNIYNQTKTRSNDF